MDTITFKSIDLNGSNLSAADKSICIEMHDAEIFEKGVNVSKISKVSGLELEYASKFVPTTPARTCCNQINSLIWSAFLLFKNFCCFRKKK